MSTRFSAGPQALGYFYQARYALYLLLNSREEAELSIEGLDDVTFEEAGSPHELLQLKHHLGRTASLTDSSSDLWWTIRLWSTRLKEGEISLPGIVLTLITTASAPENSIAAALRPGDNRDHRCAYQRLCGVAKASKNASLAPAFQAFMELSREHQEALVESIQILDKSPNIFDTADRIKQRIEFSAPRGRLDGLYERLEGWWFGKVVGHLSGDSRELIPKFEVHEKIVDIGRQFAIDALPIDFADAEPPTPPDPESDTRRFVLQLKVIAAHSKRIRAAIVDYYRAYEQRSRWVREELVFGEELEKYEKRLKEEWELYFAGVEDEIQEGASEEELQKYGRQVLSWVEREAEIPIRPRVTQPYVMRGSYHILADNLLVGWHPKFLERLQELLEIPTRG